MSLTVRELIAIPTLRTRLIAGASGLDRPVTWAHSCELPEPWQWMGSGDLVMTVGHEFPATGREQVAYLERLAEADLSGLVLAEGLFAAPVTDLAAQAADRLAFPSMYAWTCGVDTEILQSACRCRTTVRDVAVGEQCGALINRGSRLVRRYERC